MSSQLRTPAVQTELLMYEFKFLVVDYTSDASLRNLNQLGQLGWQVVGCVRHATDEVGLVYTLQRRIL
jgi:hypothetical protein